MTTCRATCILLATSLSAFAQPVVQRGGIVNAAGYQEGIAQGSMFLVFGNNLGPVQLTSNSSPALGTVLAGISVEVRSGDLVQFAPLAYVSSAQLAAILPSSTPVGTAAIVVSAGGLKSAPVEFKVVRSNFAAFTNNSRGTGAAVLQNYVSQTELARNGLSESATTGQVVILWGTGLGPIQGDDAAAPPVGNIGGSVEVTVGALPARLLYRGRSGCCAGIDQVIFEVPQGVEGCYLPVTVSVDGVASKQQTTMSVSPSGKVCTEPGLVTSDDLAKAQKQGNLKLGTLLLVSYTVDDQTAFDYGLVGFSRPLYEELAATVQRIAAAPTGACEVATWDGRNYTESGNFGSISGDFFNDYLFWSPGTPLDAGGTVTMTGAGKTIVFDKTAPGYYLNYGIETRGGQPTFQGTVGPGRYDFANSGGPDVPAFQTSVTVPERIRFTNAGTTTVSRARDLDITWTGGTQSERVLLYGWSWDVARQAGGVFACVQRGAAGKATVPASILSVLPKSGGYETGQGMGFLYLYSLTPFQRTTPPGLDAFYASTLSLTARLVQFE